MSPTSSFVGAYDLNSQSGVMSVLASIRASNISAADKNELRDLVFLYTNGGGDTSVKLALEQKLAAHQIQAVSVKKTAPAGPSLSFGSYRPTPTFKAPGSVMQTVPAPVAPAPVTPVQSTPVASAPVVPPPVQSSVPPQVPTQPVVDNVPPPTPPVAPAPAPAPVSNTGTPEDRYLDRIRQIKTAVNSKVGNPVNLVDINNEVGREYMNALLEAMKKLSSGAVSEMEPAMARLETSFTQVELAIANHQAAGSTVPVTNPAPLVAPVPEPIPAYVPPTTPAPEIVTPEPVSVVPPVPPEPAPVTPVQTEPVVTETASGFSAPPIPIVDVETPTPVVVTPTEAKAERSGFEDSSLASEKKVLTPQDLPSASSLETSADGDPLFTKEVDNGLDQLLSDWALFKKSGLFGTGPKGREHPLFKKIADLQVPILLAGRFEGSTQEIRQSVTDYMNGWRYEQGIIYSPGETFEKYLRRVIRHILDLQKSRK